MNRSDEIQAAARDIASNVHADPVMRDVMADALIRLCGLMIEAVGKHVACDGEANISNYDDESAHARYLTGERIQDGARWATDAASNPEVDLDRWCRTDPGTGCRCGHVPSVHQGGTCTGEQYNREACLGGPCTGFVTREPTGGWQYVDRRPVELRLCEDCGHGLLQHSSEAGCLDHDGESYCPCRITWMSPQQPVTVTGRCDVMVMNGGRCTKRAGHFSQTNLHTFN